MDMRFLNWWGIFIFTIIFNVLLLTVTALGEVGIGWQIFALIIIDFLIWILAKKLGIEY